MKCIAADLDRTVIPNGLEADDNSVQQFREVLEKYNLRLVYVTARRMESVLNAIERYDLPVPEAVIGQVGTTLHYNVNGSFEQAEQWRQSILSAASNWNRSHLKENLDEFEELIIQAEKEQNEFKLSYILEDYNSLESVVPNVMKQVQELSNGDAEVTASADLNSGIAYVDILPTGITKLAALDFFRTENGLEVVDLLFAGDSENDLSVLLSHYPAVVVNNASESVKKRVSASKVGVPAYLACGSNGSNGNYGAGIVEAIQKQLDR